MEVLEFSFRASNKVYKDQHPSNQVLLTSNRQISCSIFEKQVSNASTLPVA